MAKNDIVLLDGIVDRRIADRIPSEKIDEAFEFLVLEELLKDKELSADEIEEGWIDGRGDGGIDGFFLFVNGVLLQDTSDFVWPRENARLELWIITCKHHTTFEQATVEALLSTVQELFDFSIDADDLEGSYSEDLLEIRTLLYNAYRKLSIGRPEVSVNIVYASRGDSSRVGESVAARARQVERCVAGCFSCCAAVFRFIGATELVEAHRRLKKFSLSLPFSEHLSTGNDSYVVLVPLNAYWKFVSDEQGGLRRYLFDSNVRDYMGTTGVNDDIARSLASDGGPDFWWLNNGVTILATHATVTGKTIQIENIQIVNGLQTTETIHRHFSSGSAASAERSILVKIVVSSDAATRDGIIRATNNQTPVEVAALHATDKIQRDIEAILERFDWYYERRKNYYLNEGRPQNRMVTPLYIASAAVSLILKNPALASQLRSKFMRTRTGYSTVFSDDVPIGVWPVLVDVYKQADRLLMQLAPKRGERFVKTWRSLIAILAVARRLGTFNYSNMQLANVLSSGPLTEEELRDAWAVVSKVSSEGGHERKKRLRGPFTVRCCEEAAKRFGITGEQVVGRRTIGGGSVSRPIIVRAEFVDQVNALLPEQPWKPGIHRLVAEKLGKRPAEVQAAIQRLIADKRRLAQWDGVVYDDAGNVVAVDEERLRDSPQRSD